MPTVLCPACTKPTTLPDPWPHPAYTCPYCFSTVALAIPVPPPAPPPPAANPFDLGDVPSRPIRVHHRDRTTAGDSFAQGFGHALGQHVAGCVMTFFAMGFLAALFVWWRYLR